MSRSSQYNLWVDTLTLKALLESLNDLLLSLYQDDSNQFVERRLANQFRNLATGFFCSRSWAVIAQNEILSPHSQTMYSDPIV
jgi:hypothetical protein